ncbi:MAG: methyl-accepting chemotaxis protein [Polaromonas sp.]|nr:methyl-accepting chemotaxis protein [Polaromonas sp.]
MNTTIQSTKKKINIQTFGLQDIRSAHKSVAFLGIALLAVAAGVGYLSGIAATANQKATQALTNAQGVAVTMDEGAKAFYLGGAKRVGSSLPGLGRSNGQMLAVAASFRSLFADPDVAPKVLEAKESLDRLNATLKPMEASLRIADTASLDLSRYAVPLNNVATKAAPNRSNSAFTAPLESLGRLTVHAEGGVPVNALARLVYDITVIREAGRALDSAGELQGLEEIQKIAQGAANKQPSGEQITALAEAAKEANQDVSSALSALTLSKWPTHLNFAAVGLMVVGLLMLAYAIKAIMADVSGRYTKAVKQFRGQEDAREQMLNELNDIANLPSNGALLSPVNDGGEMTVLVDLVNRVLGRLYVQTNIADQSLNQSGDSYKRIMEATTAAREVGEKVISQINTTAEHALAAAEVVQVIAFDAKALQSAGTMTIAAAAEAVSVAQESATRLDAMREGLQESLRRIKGLGELSQEIASIVGGLEVISEQLQVLSLNARLESERAGEAGAGFRAVAREVQGAASRTNDYLEQVATLIQGITMNARDASTSVERAVQQVVQGSHVNTVSHALLSGLAPLAENVSNMSMAVGEEAVRAHGLMNKLAQENEGTAVTVRDVVHKVSSIQRPAVEASEALERGRQQIQRARDSVATIANINPA